MIELKNVSKNYQMGDVEVLALSEVNLKINKGDFISIVGPSGCGKSTMLNMIAALDRPTKGRVIIDMKNISGLSDNELAQVRGQKIGFIFQTFNLIGRLTALENVMLPMWFAAAGTNFSREKKAMELLKIVGLGDRIHHKPTQLSGGQRQRVAIARALANSPELIVADEPTGNLDSKSGKEIMKLLMQLHKDGKTIILVTHDKLLAKMADNKIDMLDGKII